MKKELQNRIGVTNCVESRSAPSNLRLADGRKSTKRPEFDAELLLHFYRLLVEQRRLVSPLANGVGRRGNQNRRPVNCSYARNHPVLANDRAQVHVTVHPLRHSSRISGSDFRNSLTNSDLLWLVARFWR